MRIANECNRRAAVQDFRELNAKAFFTVYLLAVCICWVAVIAIEVSFYDGVECNPWHGAWNLCNDSPSLRRWMLAVPFIVAIWFVLMAAFNGWLDRRANNRTTAPADQMPLKTRIWFKLTGGFVADESNIPLKQMFWLTICRRYKVIGMPRYWVIEDILYVWAYMVWLHVKADYKRLPATYDLVVITADVLMLFGLVLTYLGKKLIKSHDWIIRKHVARLRAQYYRKYGEEA